MTVGHPEADSKWIYLDCERLLYVNRGWETILCTALQYGSGELVLRMNKKQRDDLRAALVGAA